MVFVLLCYLYSTILLVGLKIKCYTSRGKEEFRIQLSLDALNSDARSRSQNHIIGFGAKCCASEIVSCGCILWI